jgi:hypothetical protein
MGPNRGYVYSEYVMHIGGSLEVAGFQEEIADQRAEYDVAADVDGRAWHDGCIDGYVRVGQQLGVLQASDVDVKAFLPRP